MSARGDLDLAHVAAGKDTRIVHVLDLGGRQGEGSPA